MSDPRFTLSHEDRHSSVIKKMAKYYEDRLSYWRSRNDGNFSEVETANIRGRIVEMKAFLSLCQDPVAQPDDK